MSKWDDTALRDASAGLISRAASAKRGSAGGPKLPPSKFPPSSSKLPEPAAPWTSSQDEKMSPDMGRSTEAAVVDAEDADRSLSTKTALRPLTGRPRVRRRSLSSDTVSL